jgi:P27 family predicted phage terminase small subunit
VGTSNLQPPPSETVRQHNANVGDIHAISGCLRLTGKGWFEMPRRPKPTALEILEGKPHQHAVTRFEAEFNHAIPECPNHLSREAKQHYRKLAEILYKAKVLTEADGIVLANLAQAYATLATAQRELNRGQLAITSKRGGPRANPLFRIVNESMTTINRLCQELGLTPSARSRLRIDKKSTASDDWDNIFFNIKPERLDVPRAS